MTGIRTSGMRRVRVSAFMIAALALVLSLALGACTSGASATATGTQAASTVPPKATATEKPRPKPTGVPTITLALCQQLLTVAEANQIMQPAKPATAIRIYTNSDGGSCSYEYSPFHPVVAILLLPYPSSASLDTLASESMAQAQGAKITKTVVAGIGDQALYIAASASSGGITLHYYALDTTLGSLYISCHNIVTGSPPATPQQPALTQICRQAVNRL